MAEDKKLDGLNLSDNQWGYGEPIASICYDIWDLRDLEKLFKLTKKG